MSVKVFKKIKSQQGMTLIEMMIALLILAVGLLGFAAMQTQGLVTGRKAFLSSQAQLLAEDMAERIRANAKNAAGVVAYGMTKTDPGSDKGCGANNCSMSDIRQWDQYMWKQRLSSTLPSGNGDITVTVGTDAYATVMITVYYALDKDSAKSGETGAQATYVLSTQINPT